MIVRFNSPAAIARAIALRIKHGSWNAIAIEAATAGETGNTGSTEGKSAGRRHRPNTVETKSEGSQS